MFFFFSSRRRHTRLQGDWSSDVCSSDLYNKIPHKFEAGTPNVEGAVGLAAAVDYLEAIGLERIAEHEQALAQVAIDKLTQIDGVTVYGPRDHQIGRASCRERV